MAHSCPIVGIYQTEKVRHGVLMVHLTLGLPDLPTCGGALHSSTSSVLTSYGSSLMRLNSRCSLVLGSTSSSLQLSQNRAAISFSWWHSGHSLKVQRYSHLASLPPPISTCPVQRRPK